MEGKNTQTSCSPDWGVVRIFPCDILAIVLTLCFTALSRAEMERLLVTLQLDMAAAC